MDKATDHGTNFEVHPDWGQDVAAFSLESPSGAPLATWYETGLGIPTEKHWLPGYIYVSKPFPPTGSDGSPVDFVLSGSHTTVDAKTQSPPDAGTKYQMRAHWKAWDNPKGTGVLHKEPFNENWNQVYAIFAATQAGDGWAPAGEAYAAMAVRKSDNGLTWWLIADSSNGASPTRSDLTVAGTGGALFFRAYTQTLVMDSGSSNGKDPVTKQFYHSGDDLDPHTD